MEEKKKYYYNALAYRLQCYPPPEYFMMFAGQCYRHGIGRAGLLEEILRSYFDKNYSPSERAYWLAQYDEYMIVMLLNRWNEMKHRGFTPEVLNFLYNKVKYKKVMRLNIGFNEVDFKWPVMEVVFDKIFTGAAAEELKAAIKELSNELQNYIMQFLKEVQQVKTTIR